MQTRILAAALCACVAASAAVAETIVVNDQVQLRESRADVPKRGLTMGEVEKQFGAPVTRHPAVGGGSPHQPPITRWDYNGFSVFFERDRVIHAVVTGAEAPGESGAATPGAATAPGGEAPAPAQQP
jgi:hypothetical protein